MSEAATEATTETPAQETEVTEQQRPTEDETDWKAEARKWEQRAKENGAKAKEFEKQRQASMTEAERAVAEAEARGRASAVTDFGKRLARTEFDAAAGRRNPGYDTASALEFIDLARFVNEDGEPDVKAIKQAVERLIPEPTNAPPSFDGGTRSTSPQSVQDMNTALRRATGRA